MSPTMRSSPLNKQAMDLLSERLAAAEEDTQQLSQQLSLMASNSSLTVESLDTTGQSSPPPAPPCVMSPFEAKGLKNSEALTSRLCRAESAVTTLKLALATLQNEEGRQKRVTVAVADNQISDVKKQHKEEMNKLRDEVVCLQQELLLEREAKTRSRLQIQGLQDALMEATQIRADTSTKADQLEMEKHKLLEDVANLEKQLVEEQKSRENLEVSHLSLLSRIEQMESIMDCEKNEVQGLTSMYDLLQQETDKSKTKLKEEQKQKVKIEKNCQLLLGEKNKLQDLYERSEASNKALLAEIDEQRERYAQLLTQLEQLQKLFEKQQNELKQQAEKSLLEEEITKLKSKLQSLQTELDESKQEFVNTRKELENCEKEVKSKELIILKYEQESKENIVMMEQIARLQKEKVLAINEKEKSEKQSQLLLQETTEQKLQLEKDCKCLTSKLLTCEMSSKCLQEENETLQQKIAHLERQQAATQQVDEVMKEMLEQKKKLAYEKGNLQSEVQQVQSQVHSLQNKNIQIEKELKTKESKMKQLEKQIINYEKEISVKDKNFQEMMESREKTINEMESLKEDLKNRRNKSQEKMSSLQRIVENGKIDNKKLAETLQSVIKSHNRLEHSVEELQMELGRKDNEIDYLKKERSTNQTEISNLQRELSNQQQKLMSIAAAQTEELGHVRNSLLKSKEDNKKMADSLDEVLSCNVSLKESADALMAELEQKVKNLKEIKKLREKEQNKAVAERKVFESKIESVRVQLHKEREQNNKKTSKEIVEVKHQNDRLLALNGELSCSNSELRHKILKLERNTKESNEKLQEQKRKVQHFQLQLVEKTDQIKVLRTNLEELETSNQKYLEKNNEQLLTIQRFQNQVSSLQVELSSLTALQNSKVLLQDKQIKEENQLKNDVTIQNSSHEKSRKLVLQEPDQISEKLKEAKQWFVTKFDELQKDLHNSKKMRQNLEEDHNIQQSQLEEKMRTQVANPQAKIRLKASQTNLNKLAKYADPQANLDSRIQLQQAINKENSTEKLETFKSISDLQKLYHSM